MSTGDRRWPIIDSHNHIGVRPDNAQLGEDLIRKMDKASQDMAIVFPMGPDFEFHPPRFNRYSGNAYIAEVQDKYPSRIIGVGTVNPWFQRNKISDWVSPSKRELTTVDPAVDEIETAIVKFNLRGLKFNPIFRGFTINDPILMNPIMDKLLECQKKVGRRMLVIVHCAADNFFCTPESLGDLAERYPKLTFLMVHMGSIWFFPTAVEQAEKHENIILDFTWVPFVSLLEKAISRVGAKRISAGSDSPGGRFEVKTQIVDLIVKDPQDKELILGGTLAKILGIPQIEN